MVTRKRKDDDWDEDFFGDFFEDFGFDFDKVNGRMRRIMENMIRNSDESTLGPYVYGFSYKVGPDGKPSFQEFGNIPNRPSLSARSTDNEVREPLTDINYDKDRVYLTFELPGISKENIDLKVSENEVTINVAEGPRKYYRNVALEQPVRTDSAVAKFTNGILDLTLDLERKGNNSGQSVKIE
ncbi:MAG: Hsp20/alpha crystallin family protein [Candidatus Thermoplasmatota archaeon]|nr:Hsp20/alpha crystallin family protein [Candidatus Thermoplasmatota archaeon]